MKKSLLLSFTSVFSLLLASCSNDSGSPAEETAVGGTMTATIAGQPWSSAVGGAAASITTVDVDGQSAKFLQLIGATLSQEFITIQIPFSAVSVGTHVFSYNASNDQGANIAFSRTATQSFYNSSQSTSGTTFSITISSIDMSTGVMAGTFSGTLKSIINSTETLQITNGSFTNVKIFSNDMYSNGTMSLKRGSGNVFDMDNNLDDGKYLFIGQTTENGSSTSTITLGGYNLNLGADFGTYLLTFPKNATVGSHTATSATYNAKLDNVVATSGTINITSNSNNNIKGTFNYLANVNGSNVSVSSGNFDITVK